MTSSGQERLIDTLLAHIERNAGDERLRELAAGIRSGYAGWAESLSSSFYTEALQRGLDGFTGWYDQLSDSERAEHAEHYQGKLNELHQLDQ